MYKITDQQAGDLYHLMVNLGRKQVQYSDAQDVAQEALLKAMKSYDPSHGPTFEQYAVGVVHYRTLMDKIKFIYRRKNTHSIDYIYAENGSVWRFLSLLPCVYMVLAGVSFPLCPLCIYGSI